MQKTQLTLLAVLLGAAFQVAVASGPAMPADMPKFGAAKPLQVPAIQKKTLANGL